jgi:hypothetical protein
MIFDFDGEHIISISSPHSETPVTLYRVFSKTHLSGKELLPLFLY